MNPTQPLQSKSSRVLGLFTAIGMAFAPVSPSVAENDSAGSQQLNPSPEKCCECIKLTVCSSSPDGDNVDGSASPATNRDGSYQVKVTLELKSIIDSNTGNDICYGLQVTDMILRSKGTSSHTIVVEQGLPMGDGDTITISVPENLVREHGSEWEAVVFCSSGNYEDGKGCKVPFTMGGGCTSCGSGADCEYTGGVQVATMGEKLKITTNAPNSDGVTGGSESGVVVCRINGMNFQGLGDVTYETPNQPTTTTATNGDGRFVSCQGENGSSLNLSEVAGETAILFSHKDPTGTEFRSTKIAKVNEGGDDVIRIDTTFNLTTWRHERKETAPGVFQLEHGQVVAGVFKPLSRETLTKTVPSPGVHVLLRKVEERPDDSSPWFVASEIETTHEKQVHGWVKTKQVIDPNGEALTSTWTYYQPGEVTGPGNSIRGLGWIKQYNRYDGYQSFHAYGLNYESVTTPYAGDVSGKTVTTTWNPSARSRAVTTTVSGQVIAKSETLYTDDSTERRVYTDAGAYLATKTTYKASGADFGGKPLKVEHSDGTLTTYAYTRETGGGYTTVMENGAANDGSTVSLGMRTTTTTNSRGTAILSKSEAIGYGTGNAIFGNMAVTSVDSLGRSLGTAYHADAVSAAGEQATASNPSWTTTKEYGCCGVTKETDKYGITTFYAYDGIKRRIKSNRIGVSMESVRKGLISETHRYAEAVSGTLGNSFAGTAATLISKSERNLAGTLSESFSPDPTSAVAGTLIKSSSSVTTYQPGAGLSMSVVTSVPKPGGGTDSQTTENFLDGRTAKTTGALSPEMQYSYTVNATGEVATQSYLDGANLRETTTSQSDLAGRSVSTTYQDGAVATMAYNALGQMVSSTDPDGVTTLMNYNSEGEQTVTALDLNANGAIDYGVDTVSYSETDPGLDGSDPVFVSISKVWQPGDTNPAAGTVTSTSTRSPDGLSASSQQLGVANPITSLTVLAGSGDWTTTSTSPDGTKQVQTYTDGLLTSSSWNDTASAAIASATYSHDSLNRQTNTTDSRTGAVTTAYLSATNDMVASVTDAGGRTTAFTYDVRGRRTHVDAPDAGGFANITETLYNPDNTVAETTGDQTYRTTHLYDYADRQVKMTTYGTQTATTEWFYSANRGFMTQKKYPDGKSTIYSYTNAGRLLVRVWARTEGGSPLSTVYQFDAGGRQIGVNYDGSTPDVSAVLDCLGRQVSQTNGVATCNYTYSASTLVLTSETISYDFNLDSTVDLTRTIDRSQDSLLRSSGFTLKDGATVDTQAGYNYGATDGRLAQITSPSGNFGYSYIAASANLLASVTGPAHTVANTYDGTRDVLFTKTNHTGNPANPVSSFDYSQGSGVNDLGQRTTLVTTGSGFDGTAFANTAATGPAYGWTYNNRGELVSADDTSAADEDRAYSFDGIGNRITSTASGQVTNYFADPAAGAGDAGANINNQYRAIQFPGAATPMVTTFDNDGNMTSGPLPKDLTTNSALAWDAENRLISSTTNGVTTTFQYDSQSRRIAKTSGGVTTLYVYDGWNMIAEYVAGSLTKSYTWGMDLSGSMQGAGGVGGLLAVKDGSGSYYPTYDGNGNVSEYLDGTGAIQAHYEYDAFGKETVSVGTLAASFEFRFSTKLLDGETGLYYYGYRYYDPETGRWLNRDPIEELVE